MLTPDLPRATDEQLSMLEGILTSRATGGTPNDAAYRSLRLHLLADPVLADLLPRFVRAHRDLDAFWSFIKIEAPTYEERRQIIRAAFGPVMDHVEGWNRAPVDTAVSYSSRASTPRASTPSGPRPWRGTAPIPRGRSPSRARSWRRSPSASWTRWGRATRTRRTCRSSTAGRPPR